MNYKRKIEIFSAGCSCCNKAVETIKQMACPSCEVEVLDMRRAEVAEKAEEYGIESVPGVVIDGKPASCCAGRGIDKAALRRAGVGVSLA